MSHSEFIKSIRENDGRKWLIEERNGVSHYLEIADDQVEGNPYAKVGEGWAAARRRRVREQLAKRVSKPEKPYTWRLGYNHCIGQFVNQEGKYATLSGSSLNRHFKPKIKYYQKLETLPDDRPPAVHYLSRRSRGKIKDKTTAFYRVIPRDRVFLTLTFIQHTDDWTGVKILNKFLTVVRRERPGFQYIWVAEHQPDRKEKTIHFHVVMNRKLPVARYNALWVLQQYNAGLIGHRADGSEISHREILDRYEDGTVQKVLNPLDVRKAYGINGLAHYLTMYVSKQVNDDPFGCRTWHCSRKVSKLFTRQVVGPSTFAYLQTFANYQVDRKTGECTPPKIFKKQFFCMVYVNNKGAPLPVLRQMETVNKWIIKDFEPDRPSEISDDQYRRIIYDGKLPAEMATTRHVRSGENFGRPGDRSPPDAAEKKGRPPSET